MGLVYRLGWLDYTLTACAPCGGGRTSISIWCRIAGFRCGVLTFFLSALFVSSVRSFLLFKGSSVGERAGARWPYTYNWRRRGIMLSYSGLGGLWFLVSSSRFTFTSFFVTSVGSFLGRGSRLRHDHSGRPCVCDPEARPPGYRSCGFLMRSVDESFLGSSGAFCYRLPVFPLPRGEEYTVFLVQVGSQDTSSFKRIDSFVFPRDGSN